MTATMTRFAEPEIITDETTETDKAKMAHIVKTGPGESAAGKVLEARIYGLVIEALCGYKWVPSQNPENLDVCPECVEIYELWRSHNDGLNERPAA